LKKLFDQSTSIYKYQKNKVPQLDQKTLTLLSYFQNFQQVAVRNKVNLKELVAIEFSESFKNDKILNYISKNYPNIEIIITKS
jgi:hypothetical protein